MTQKIINNQSLFEYNRQLLKNIRKYFPNLISNDIPLLLLLTPGTHFRAIIEALLRDELKREVI